MLYGIYKHEGVVELVKIEHEAVGRVLYFYRRDHTRVLINPVKHEGPMLQLIYSMLLINIESHISLMKATDFPSSVFSAFDKQ